MPLIKISTPSLSLNKIMFCFHRTFFHLFKTIYHHPMYFVPLIYNDLATITHHPNPIIIGHESTWNRVALIRINNHDTRFPASSIVENRWRAFKLVASLLASNQEQTCVGFFLSSIRCGELWRLRLEYGIRLDWHVNHVFYLMCMKTRFWFYLYIFLEEF